MFELERRSINHYQNPFSRVAFFWCPTLPKIPIASASTTSRPNPCGAVIRNTVGCGRMVGAIRIPFYCSCALVLFRALPKLGGSWWDDESRRVLVRRAKPMRVRSSIRACHGRPRDGFTCCVSSAFVTWVYGPFSLLFIAS